MNASHAIQLTLTDGLFLVAGYVVSLIVGQLAAGGITRHLWAIVENEAQEHQPRDRPPLPIRSSATIARWQGTAERFVYTSTIVLGRPEGIAVWLAFKAVMRWKVYEQDIRHVSGSAVFVVGAIVSLVFGVLGGLIATRSWKL